MKAAVCTKYGPPEVLQLRDVPKPAPKDDEVLIKVFAAAVTASDIYIRSSQIPLRRMVPMRLMIGLTKPRKPVLGVVLAGVVESAGSSIKRFKPGDQVYGMTGFGFGAYAEYKCMRETDSTSGCLAFKPRGITFEEATSAAYGGLLALQAIEKCDIQPGQKVLVYGASGTSGTLAVQLAKHLGGAVTGVCGHANLEFVKALGADTVLDYTAGGAPASVGPYDVMLDTAGRYRTSALKEACIAALKPGGKFASIDDGALKLDSGRLERLRQLIEAGYIKPVLDRIFPLEQIVEAHRYVEKWHKRGGVAVTIG